MQSNGLHIYTTRPIDEIAHNIESNNQNSTMRVQIEPVMDNVLLGEEDILARVSNASNDHYVVPTNQNFLASDPTHLVNNVELERDIIISGGSNCVVSQSLGTDVEHQSHIRSPTQLGTHDLAQMVGQASQLRSPIQLNTHTVRQGDDHIQRRCPIHSPAHVVDSHPVNWKVTVFSWKIVGVMIAVTM
ncbi:unnamed protein product, partial [Meganyctiphanes norvegica]